MTYFTKSDWGKIKAAVELHVPGIFEAYTGNLHGVAMSIRAGVITLHYYANRPILKPCGLQEQDDRANKILFSPNGQEPILLAHCGGVVAMKITIKPYELFGEQNIRKHIDKYRLSAISMD